MAFYQELMSTSMPSKHSLYSITLWFDRPLRYSHFSANKRNLLQYLYR
jgi:hypothetical protein